MDVALLKELGARGDAFMREVRALPHFQTSWDGKQPHCGFIANQSLNACEATFRKNFAATMPLLLALPLTSETREGDDAFAS